MKKSRNKGGRPPLGSARKQSYTVSTRLDIRGHIHLKSLTRKSGKQPSQIIRELIAKG